MGAVEAEGGEPLETSTILITDPNESAEQVRNHMPVILELGNYTRWMGTVDPARPPIDLLRPYPVEKIGSWAVDERVGNVSNDDPKLPTERPIQPLLFSELPIVLPSGQRDDSA